MKVLELFFRLEKNLITIWIKFLLLEENILKYIEINILENVL